MVRNILPLASLTLTLGLTLGMGAAQAEDAALVARVTAAAEKACGPVQVYDGPRHLFYPMTFKAEHETCVRMTTIHALKQFAANGSFEQVAQK